jgi:hypothetical protein
MASQYWENVTVQPKSWENKLPKLCQKLGSTTLELSLDRATPAKILIH